MGRRRKERQEEYLNPRVGQASGYSSVLLTGANTLLHAALHDRVREVYRTATDHASDNSAGAIVLVATAFDTWLTECLGMLSWVGLDDARADGLKATVTKYEALARRVEVSVPRELVDDLLLVVEIRDDIVHRLPRPTRGEGNVPEWLVPLHQRGVFLSTEQKSDFTFEQKLGNYALAYWAFRTLHVTVALLAESVAAERRHPLMLASNFYRYASLCPPERLAEFDAEHGLSLTPKHPGLDG